jgi:hypothetical protein
MRREVPEFRPAVPACIQRGGGCAVIEDEASARGDDRVVTVEVDGVARHAVAWMGSHAHSKECREIGPGYTADSCALARRFLHSGGRSLDPDTRAPGQPRNATLTTPHRS